MHPLATKNLDASPLMGLLQIDQLAFVARNDNDEKLIKRMLRLEAAEWVVDRVTAVGYVAGVEPNQTNYAKLQFNYDLGIEVEILRYEDGPNYVDHQSIPSGNLAHIGFHVEKGKSLPPRMRDFVFSANVIQQVETQHHTNKFLIETGRRYRYTIYDTRPLFGVNLKVIERLEQI